MIVLQLFGDEFDRLGECFEHNTGDLFPGLCFC